jgi:hypothetical protein
MLKCESGLVLTMGRPNSSSTSAVGAWPSGGISSGLRHLKIIGDVRSKRGLLCMAQKSLAKNSFPIRSAIAMSMGGESRKPLPKRSGDGMTRLPLQELGGRKNTEGKGWQGHISGNAKEPSGSAEDEAAFKVSLVCPIPQSVCVGGGGGGDLKTL